MALDQAHDEAQMGFLDHLEELRRRLFVSAAAIMAAGIGVFVAKDWVFDRILFGPRDLDFISYRGWCALSHAIGSGDALCVERISYELINTTMLGNFTTHILVSAIAGFIAAFPLVFWQGWLFVRPALKES
ncbi:MAG: twin-arginine translocase subunit TatC, partial [Flavobacteriales bacterium]